MQGHRRKIALFACLALLTWSVGNATAAATETPPVDIELTLTWGGEGSEKIPYFNMTITNVSTTPIRALDIRNRSDFVDLYCDVQIVPLDRSFELSRAISDPNVINDTDYVELAPGEKLKFKSILLPIDYRELVPGKYVAQGVYRIDPIRRPREIYKSEEVIFEME